MILNPLEADYGVERGLLDASERDGLERSGLIRGDLPDWPLARDDEDASLGAPPQREYVRYVWWIVELLRLREDGWSVVGSREALAAIDLAHNHPQVIFNLAVSEGLFPRARVSDSPGLAELLDERLDAELRLRGTSLEAVTSRPTGLLP